MHAISQSATFGISSASFMSSFGLQLDPLCVSVRSLVCLYLSVGAEDSNIEDWRIEDWEIEMKIEDSRVEDQNQKIEDWKIPGCSVVVCCLCLICMYIDIDSIIND